jgi:hypothetical protein
VAGQGGRVRLLRTYAWVTYESVLSRSHWSVVRTEPRIDCPVTRQTVETFWPSRSDPVTRDASEGPDRVISVLLTLTVAVTPAAWAGLDATTRPAPAVSAIIGTASSRRVLYPMKSNPFGRSAVLRR